MTQTYDEFAYFRENAEEFGLPFSGPPAVRRVSARLPDGRQLSGLVWGDDPPELVLLHGGAQNAHTWDTVALALDRPLLALDLPGHGHSDGGRTGSFGLGDNAADVAEAIRQFAPAARAVVGMSLGGLTTVALAGTHPDLTRAIVLVDITPGVTGTKSAAISAFVNGPTSFADFDEILARTIAFNPMRTVSSLRRGILHNAVQQADGSWVWRYARFRSGDEAAPPPPDFGALWDTIGAFQGPVMLVRGMRAQSVVDDEDEAELRRRRPDARIEHVDAGHSVQGDAPIELARLLASFAGLGPRRRSG